MGFGGFGGQEEEEEKTPKGEEVKVELEVTLEDLYLGHTMEVSSEQNGSGQRKPGQGSQSRQGRLASTGA